MAQLGQAFSQLHQITSDFNMKSQYGKNEVQEKIYFSLQNCFNHWSEKTVRVVKSIDTNFIDNLEWTRAELEVMKDLVKERNTVCTEYYKSKLQLKDKKDYILKTQKREKNMLDARSLSIMKITPEQACDNDN